MRSFDGVSFGIPIENNFGGVGISHEIFINIIFIENCCVGQSWYEQHLRLLVS
jgi:hypothetical protein